MALKQLQTLYFKNLIKRQEDIASFLSSCNFMLKLLCLLLCLPLGNDIFQLLTLTMELITLLLSEFYF